MSGISIIGIFIVLLSFTKIFVLIKADNLSFLKVSYIYSLKLASIEFSLNFKDKFTVIVTAIDPSLLISLLGISIVDSLSKDTK
ncbi:hypothetical protein [Catenibacterium sp.]|uniref:hypothetical protein n=1 Tax=Catenibacterium sp. TaxID=2049022 RepID=UPI002E759C0D|nr:hypothetical protein [Catenibacterium sp.]MEE0042582.1 hypothetical protein [Catenibacterium sp.]